MRKNFADAIRSHIVVPAHITAMASACAYDLMNGPTFSQKPTSGNWEDFTVDDYATFAEDLDGEVVETYSGAPAALLREFMLTLPGDLYIEEDSECVMTSEPEGEWLDDDMEPCDRDAEAAEWHEPPAYYAIDHQDIIEALFGTVIAKNFY